MTAVPVSAKREFLEGVHRPSDVYKIALYTSKAKHGEKTTEYSNENEVEEGNGYETGGKVLKGYAIKEEKDSAILDFENPVWANASISARSLLIYNATKENRVIAVYYFVDPEIVTSTNGYFTVNIPGLIRLI